MIAQQQQQQQIFEKQKKSLFTCITCHVVFPTSENQRNHYRTDWHKYNLKRKVAELPPINAEQFAEKILASKVKGREEEERMGLIYECVVCRKSYYSENAYNNHIQSKKHREMEEQIENNSDYNEKIITDKENDKENDIIENSNRKTCITDSERECLFCSETSHDFDTNISHMKTIHGFFLPDIEYLQDSKGLINYLAKEKINHGICLYCNGRGKEYKTVDAVSSHMIDVGHCKMAYDESEDPEELLKYYDFGDLVNDNNIISSTDNFSNNELVLNNGLRISHRRFLKTNKHLYRQQQQQQQQQSLDKEEEEEEEEKQDILLLPRRERRQQQYNNNRLAITDGNISEQQQNTAQGIREISVKQHFIHKLSAKNNLNTTLRARAQVPI